MEAGILLKMAAAVASGIFFHARANGSQLCRWVVSEPQRGPRKVLGIDQTVNFDVKFESVWEEGTVVTDAKLNLTSGIVFDIVRSAQGEDYEALVREQIVIGGEKIRVELAPDNKNHVDADRLAALRVRLTQGGELSRKLRERGEHAVNPADSCPQANQATTPTHMARQVIHLLSAEGHGEYDLYALAPEGMTAQGAKNIINAQIRRANTEDARNEAGGCDDGHCVEESIKNCLSKLGFEVFKPTMTNCWDEHSG